MAGFGLPAGKLPLLQGTAQRYQRGDHKPTFVWKSFTAKCARAWVFFHCKDLGARHMHCRYVRLLLQYTPIVEGAVVLRFSRSIVCIMAKVAHILYTNILHGSRLITSTWVGQHIIICQFNTFTLINADLYALGCFVWGKIAKAP